MMVGRRFGFLFGAFRPIFRGKLAVKLQEGILYLKVKIDGTDANM